MKSFGLSWYPPGMDGAEFFPVGRGGVGQGSKSLGPGQGKARVKISGCFAGRGGAARFSVGRGPAAPRISRAHGMIIAHGMSIAHAMV